MLSNKYNLLELFVNAFCFDYLHMVLFFDMGNCFAVGIGYCNKFRTLADSERFA